MAIFSTLADNIFHIDTCLAYYEKTFPYGADPKKGNPLNIQQKPDYSRVWAFAPKARHVLCKLAQGRLEVCGEGVQTPTEGGVSMSLENWIRRGRVGIIVLGATAAALVAVGPALAVSIPCTNDDVTFGVAGPPTADADACFGWEEGIDKPVLINARFPGDRLDPWVDLLKIEVSDGEATATGVYGGLTFTLVQVGIGATSGSWELSWAESAPGALPKILDFAVALKASNQTAGYLFDDVFLPWGSTEGGGTWQVTMTNKNGPFQALSHFSIYTRGAPPSVHAPEPGTMVLLGSGLIGLARLGRRRMKQV